MKICYATLVFGICVAVSESFAALTITVLYSFALGGSGGAAPRGGFVRGRDGKLYGTTSQGGRNNSGTVFALTPDGTLTTLYSFSGGSDGEAPVAALVQGTDGNFYGTTSSGGPNFTNGGTIFKITPTGEFTTLHNFTGSSGTPGFSGGNNDGNSPRGSLIQASDGNLYGTTDYGGLYRIGTVFRMTPTGNLITIYSFMGGEDGAQPLTGLVQDKAGNLYGTTVINNSVIKDSSGNSGHGTVFKMTTSGTLTTLYNFPGQAPHENGLVLGVDGSIYGTAEKTSTNLVFKISAQGTTTSLFEGGPSFYSFNQLVLASDGNFYGTMPAGGSEAALVKVSPDGTITTLYFFKGGHEGISPTGVLAQGSNGDFYGMMGLGGDNHAGTIYRISGLSLPPASGLLQPSITTQPQPQIVPVGSNVTFTVAANGTPPLNVQWRKDGVVISGATSATFTLLSVSALSAGNYSAVVTNSAGSVASNGATLAVTGSPVVVPTIASQPVGQSVNLGLSVGFSVGAIGTAPLSYQWRVGGTAISGATNPGFALANVQASNAGGYDVVITNSAGSVTSTVATLTVNVPSVAPTISAQPQPQSVTAGANVTFGVVAAGTAPLSFQWRKDGAAISGATGATLTLTNVPATNAGIYTVVITNAASSVTSSPATLSISPLVIATQPIASSVLAGGNVSFSVVATGTGPFSYQWARNGVAITGATSALLSLSNVLAANAGTYSVVVSNSSGSVTSNAAVLAVAGIPPIPVLGQWSPMEPMPTARSSPGVGVLNGALYAVGGTKEGVQLTTVEAYAPTTNSWTPRTSMSTRRNAPGVGAVSGSLYVVGGHDGRSFLAGVESYDPLTDKWRSVAPMQSARQNLGVATVNGVLYAFGGSNGTAVAIVEAYDPVSDKWTTKGQMPAGLVGAAVGTVNGIIYVAGGINSSSSTVDTVYAFNPAADKWTPKTRMLAPRAGTPVGGVIDGKFYVAGGASSNGQHVTTAEVYDPATDRWSPAPPLPVAMVYRSGAVISGTFYVVGGLTFGGSPEVATNLAFTPDLGRIVNLSVLTDLPNPGDAFTMGFVVGGSETVGTKPLIVRAAGPSLAALGVPATVDDPRLEYFQGTAKIGENDNWGGSPAMAAAMSGVGAFPYIGPNSRDAAVSAVFNQGDNSVRVSAAGSGTGAVIAEVYDSTPAASFIPPTARLVNVSVLKNVGQGLTVGFVIGGSTSKTVLIRAIGPTLGVPPFGVSGVLADPQLSLFFGQTNIGSNDNWGGTADLVSAFARVGAFPLPGTSRDAALTATLQPGNYSVQVSGQGGTTGVALVEVYEAP